MTELQRYTYAERPDLIEAAGTLAGQVWPEFMLNDPVASLLQIASRSMEISGTLGQWKTWF